MKRYFIIIPIIFIVLVMGGCGNIRLQITLVDRSETSNQPPTWPKSTDAVTEQTTPTMTQPIITIPTQPPHSDLYISGVSADDVIAYFNEVVLDSEYSTGPGDSHLVQKWDQPIYYMLEGNYTQEDLRTLQEFADFFNSMSGSPGMYPASSPEQRNLRICFTDPQGMVDILGDNLSGADGGVTYWYNEDRIYDSTICIIHHLQGAQRRSVLLEELYNGSGLAQDSSLRTDSLIYFDSDTAQWMTEIDQLLIRLLYHPQIQPGMDASQCETIIRSLYY